MKFCPPKESVFVLAETAAPQRRGPGAPLAGSAGRPASALARARLRAAGPGLAGGREEGKSS